MCALPNGKLAVSCVNQTLVILSIDNSAEQFIIKDDLPKNYIIQFSHVEQI